MAQFFGEYSRNVDDKGRITIPTSYRNILGDGEFIIAIGSGEYLTVYTSEDWGEYFQKRLVDDDADKEKVAEIRDIARTAHPVKFDSQGKISIPDKHRKHAKISEGIEVTIIGLGNRIEIWNKQKLED
ncbi:MAG: cell division/cell wall cluster transcriptional repressor MraZ [Eubacteriales bacterium]